MRTVAVFMLAMLAGCAAGPDFHRPELPAVSAYTVEPLPTNVVAGRDMPAQWWQLFHSPELTSLVEQAMRANPGVEAARAGLRAAEEAYLAQRAALFPLAAASVSGSRQKIPPALAGPLVSGASLYTLRTAQVTVSYSPDVFGGTRRQAETMKALAESQRFELQAAYVALSANVVAAAIQEASLRAQIDAMESLVAVEREQTTLLERQLELGAVAEAGLVAQRTLLAQTEATLPSLRKQLAQQRNLLVVLAGGYPGQGLAQTFHFSSLELPAELPAGVPSKLVERRPDVRAAEAELHAAAAQVGVATANLLPQFTIDAAIGTVAGGGFWTLAANMAQPLFQGGALVHRKRAAEAAYEQAAAAYRATVLGAFQNVADSLRALEYDAAAFRAALNAKRLAEESLAIARRQVELGDISYFALLAVQQAYQETSLAFAQAQANRYVDAVALFQALGGGWWNDAGLQP